MEEDVGVVVVASVSYIHQESDIYLKIMWMQSILEPACLEDY